MPVFLTFIGLAVGSWAIGKVVDWAWKKGEEAFKGENDEDRNAQQSKAESGATMKSIEALGRSLKGGLDKNQESMWKQTTSLRKLEATSDSSQTMKGLVQSMRSIEGSANRQRWSAEKIQAAVDSSENTIGASMGDFKRHLSDLNAVEKSISTKVINLICLRHFF